MAKFVFEKSLQADAPEGFHYVRQAMGFSDACEACKKTAKMFMFSRNSEKGEDRKDPLISYGFGPLVCSVECFRTTPEYAADQAVANHNDRVAAKERAEAASA